MSDEELDPVDPELAGLFAAERSHAAAPAGSKARVFERLAASIAGGGSGGSGGGGGPAHPSPAPATALARALPILGAFVVGGAVGAGLMAARPPQIVYVERVVEPASVVEAPVAADPAIGLLPAVVAGSASAPPRASASAAESADVSLARERAILDVARTAVGRGDGTHALEAVDRHARDFPHGQLVEEREALAIQALARLRRADEARARASRFHRRYPHSVLIPVVDAAVESAASPGPEK